MDDLVKAVKAAFTIYIYIYIYIYTMVQGEKLGRGMKSDCTKLEDDATWGRSGTFIGRPMPGLDR